MWNEHTRFITRVSQLGWTEPKKKKINSICVLSVEIPMHNGSCTPTASASVTWCCRCFLILMTMYRLLLCFWYRHRYTYTHNVSINTIWLFVFGYYFFSLWYYYYYLYVCITCISIIIIIILSVECDRRADWCHSPIDIFYLCVVIHCHTQYEFMRRKLLIK